jgi:MFS family permease
MTDTTPSTQDTPELPVDAAGIDAAGTDAVTETAAAPDAPETLEAPELPELRGPWWTRLWRGVWREPDFLKLWIGQTASQLGSQVTRVASPRVAVVYLHASAGQMGVLGALGRLPFLLYLVVGVWIDRMRRRPVVIGSDLARGVLLLGVPLAAFAGVLSFWLLAALTFLVMLLSVWFDIGYMSYVPGLVEKKNLMQANTIMESSRSSAQFAGPGVGGVLVQVLTAPAAILIDCASYFVSAFAVWRIRKPEPAPEPSAGHGIRGVASSIGEGMRFLVKHPTLRPMAIAIGINNLAWAAELALYVLFLARTIGLSAPLIGLTLAASGPGALVGSMLAGKVQKKIGLAGAIVGGLLLFAAAALLIPFAPHQPAVAVPVLMVAAFCMSLGGQVCAVNVLTTRQIITPDRLQGRVNASFRFLALGVSPLGSLLGGLLGTVAGTQPALFISIAAMFLGPIVMLVSPVRRVRQIPETAE